MKEIEQKTEMSRIIVEKELNKKLQQSQPQAGYAKVSYEPKFINDNQILTSNSNESKQNNEIPNPSPFSQSILQGSIHFQQVQSQNIIEKDEKVIAPIVQISPFAPIQPVSQYKNDIPERDPYSSTIYNTTYDIFGTEMTAKEADDLFDDAEKLVGWSYWKINE